MEPRPIQHILGAEQKRINIFKLTDFFISGLKSSAFEVQRCAAFIFVKSFRENVFTGKFVCYNSYIGCDSMKSEKAI